MASPVCTEDEFINLVQTVGAEGASKILGVTVRGVYKRKADIEKRKGALIGRRAGPVINLQVNDGVVLVGSDAHIWPGDLTVAQRAFLHFSKELKPIAIIANGDFFDGASISRHPSIGWESRPTVKEELEAVGDYLHKLQGASKNSKLLWPAGNHDLRFESRLANVAGEFRDVQGIHLKDHFPAWQPCWRVDINEDVVVKHRWKGGIHATHNNTLQSGKTIVTGHLHSLKVTPWTDYKGTRYGVDTGTMADADAEQFVHYTEAGPTNWRSGFVVLTFRKGRLLWPEVVSKIDEDSVEFRGEIISI